MTERPILFSGPMVRAILEGRKTQTRRIIKLPHNNPLGAWEPTTVGGGSVKYAGGTPAPELAAIWHTRTGQCYVCPHGDAGDRLWVRETHEVGRIGTETFEGGRPTRRYAGIAYQADDGRAEVDIDLNTFQALNAKEPRGWSPSIHMPRWASRITLEITGVRAERLQSIGWDDAIAGGIPDPRRAARRVDPVEGTVAHARSADIKAPDVARYLRKERKDAPVRANREIALLSNLIGLAIEFGQAETNPCREVRRNEEQPRTETVDPAEFAAFASWLAGQGGQRAVVGMAAEYAALAGNRKVEFLDLTWPQVDRAAGYIRVKRAKQRGKKRGEVIEQIEITPPLSELLDRLEAIRGDRECLYVFTTRFGTHYTRDGFKGFWGKLMNEALAEKIIASRFTFHDLRAYYATHFKQTRGTLPDLHANPATTARVYDRNKIVKRKAL